MNTHPYTPAIDTLSLIVAEAATELPPLTDADDGKFLRIVLAQLVEVFWENYLFLLPQAAQEEYEMFMEADDVEGMTRWHRTYANFKTDPEAEAKGAKVLEDIALKLPQVMKEQYASFTATTNV